MRKQLDSSKNRDQIVLGNGKPQDHAGDGAAARQQSNPTRQSEVAKFFATRRELVSAFGSAALFQELLDAGWIKAVRPGKRGRATLYCFESAIAAAARIRAGELPKA